MRKCHFLQATPRSFSGPQNVLHSLVGADGFQWYNLHVLNKEGLLLMPYIGIFQVKYHLSQFNKLTLFSNKLLKVTSQDQSGVKVTLQEMHQHQRITRPS